MDRLNELGFEEMVRKEDLVKYLKSWLERLEKLKDKVADYVEDYPELDMFHDSLYGAICDLEDAIRELEEKEELE